MSKRPRTVTRIAGAAIVLGVSVALLLVVELATRTALRLSTGSWPVTAQERSYRAASRVAPLFRRHPYLNGGPRAGATVTVGGKRAHLNADGYRSPEREREKTDGIFRIVAAGGSTTFDSLAEADDESWPWLLEAGLREAAVPTIEVWNAGVPTWTSLENAISLLLRDGDLEPDLVLLYQGFNDLQPAAHRPFDREYVDGHADVARAALGLEARRPGLLSRSVLLERLRGALGRTSATPHDAEHSTVSDDGVRVFERNVRSFVAIARSRGSNVLLITQPIRVRAHRRKADLEFLQQWLPELDSTAVEGELERMNDVLRSLAEELDTPLFDAAQVIDWTDRDFGDAVHFVASGSEKMADRLGAFLIGEGLLASQTDHPAAVSP